MLLRACNITKMNKEEHSNFIIFRYYYVRLNDSSVSKIEMGKSINDTIESDAYWVTYVRED